MENHSPLTETLRHEIAHMRPDAPPIMKVVKRSGSIENYDRRKIEAAIEKAYLATDTPVADASGNSGPSLCAALVEKRLAALAKERHPHSIPAIEEIQDIVESVLIERGEAAAAKAYILYRARHEAMRDARKLSLDISATMDGYLDQSDWRVHENANVDYSLGGLILHNSGTLTANYWLRKIYPSDIADAHTNADFHIHDLSMFSGYCAGWSLRDLIRHGLGGVYGRISSKPASHLSTLVNQMVNFLGILQNEWAGAQAFSSFDTYLAPFVKADDLCDSEIRQCVQSFIFGVNTPSRWGCQAPFTNITLDWTVPKDLRDQKAIVGGREREFTYGDCKPEMDRINKAFIELMIQGDAEGRGFQYPIPTYNITDNFDWDSPNAELLFKMTARYGTPYFQNFVNSDLDPCDVRSMCCRLRLDKRELRKKGGGLFGADELTGSIGVVTINLPRIGYLSRNEKEFYERLDALMDKAKDSLVIKRKVLRRLLDAGLFPYTKRYLPSFGNHFGTIGIVGMNECLQSFFSPEVTTATARGRRFALDVLRHMRERLSDYQEETGDLFNLEATPAESTSYRLARHDREQFPDIIAAGAEAPYYTNSTQLPVGYTSDIFDALDLQEELQTAYTGGTVFHIFLGEAVDDWRSCARLVKTISSTYRIPYFTVSPTFSVCPTHGYLKGEKFFCDICADEERAKIGKEISALEAERKAAAAGSPEKIAEIDGKLAQLRGRLAAAKGTPTEVYSRIVGYYRSVKNWNAGKREEYRERRMFDAVSGNCAADARGEAAHEEAARAESAARTTASAADSAAAAFVETAAGRDAAGERVMLFTREHCPRCLPAKRALGELGIAFEEIDCDSPRGESLAAQYSIASTPTAVIADQDGNESVRLHSPAEMMAFFAARP